MDISKVSIVFLRRFVTGCFFLSLMIVVVGCMRKGLVSQEYEPSFYRVSKPLPDDIRQTNPTFLVIGDTQADWRIREHFLKRKNWLTWKMAIVPFYQMYWIGNGITGLVNRLRQVPDCGLHTRIMMRDAIYAETQRSDIDFILNLGDIVLYDGRRPEHWEGFLSLNKENHPLLLDIPYLPVVGNHDRVNDSTYGLPNYEAVFGRPRFYVEEFADVVLYILDSNIIIDWKQNIDDDRQDEMFERWFVSDDPDHPAWLERQLVKYKDKPFQVIAMHHPMITIGWHYRDWDNKSFGRNSRVKRRRLIDLFQKYNVQIVFSGHEHIYQHNILTYGDDDQQKIHFITSSSGGVPLRELVNERTRAEWLQDYRHEDMDVSPVILESRFHYCRVDVMPDRMSVTTVEVLPDTDEQFQVMEEILITK
ncbi:MAG: metallophosphoesterase [Candidatus Electryoneaceae bacterium]|nr:metallophosphoesterase [Candidatus Electryoneaceae bacterium]